MLKQFITIFLWSMVVSNQVDLYDNVQANVWVGNDLSSNLCQLDNTFNLPTVSVSNDEFFNGASCGMCLAIGEQLFMVVDRNWQGWRSDYPLVTDNSVTISSPNSWTAVACPVADTNISYKNLGSSYWLKLQIFNSRYSIKTVAIKASTGANSDDYVPLTATNGFWQFNGNSFTLFVNNADLLIKVCNVYDECLENVLTSSVNGNAVTGNSPNQFTAQGSSESSSSESDSTTASPTLSPSNSPTMSPITPSTNSPTMSPSNSPTMSPNSITNDSYAYEECNCESQNRRRLDIYDDVQNFFTEQVDRELTYYWFDNTKNCGLQDATILQSGFKEVAVTTALYKQGVTCGTCLEIYHTAEMGGLGLDEPAEITRAIVTDQLENDNIVDIDVFANLDGQWNINWKAVPCPTIINSQPLHLTYRFEGSNLWYLKLQVRNGRYPVKSVQLDETYGNLNLVRPAGVPDNFFEGHPSITVTFPLKIKVCDIWDQCVDDELPSFVDPANTDNLLHEVDQVGNSKVQFPDRDCNCSERRRKL